MERSLGTWYFDKRTKKRKYAALNGKVYTGSDGMRMARADAYSPSHPSQLLRAQLMLHVKACNIKYLCGLHAATAAATGSTELSNLGMFGLPPQLLQDYAEANVSTLFPWQIDCLLSDQGRVLAGEQNLIFSAPTSGGKTLVAEILMLHCLARTMQLGDPHNTPRKTVFFVVPFVALAEEKATHFRNVWKTLNIGIKTFHTQDGNLQSLTPEVEVAIITIERANLLLNQLMHERREQQLAMVVIDEVHLLGDPHRGYLLEVFLSKLRYLADIAPVQIVAMSATLPNLEDLGHWLRATVYRTKTRVTSLQTYVCMRGQLVRVEYTQAENPAGSEAVREMRTSTVTTTTSTTSNSSKSTTSNKSGSIISVRKLCTPESSQLVKAGEKKRRAPAASWEVGESVDDQFYACADMSFEAGVTAASPIWSRARDMLSSWTYSEPSFATPDSSLDSVPPVLPPSPTTTACPPSPRMVFHPPTYLPSLPASRGPGQVHDPDHLLAVLRHYLPLTQSILIFCASKLKCEGACQTISRAMASSVLHDGGLADREVAAARGQLVEALALASLGGLHPLIPQCIPHGVFFHHAGLGQEERVLIENAFRKGILRMLCTTSTLSAGVNLPAQVVILRSLTMGGRPLTVSDFKQMCGRAGRLGCALPAPSAALYGDYEAKGGESSAAIAASLSSGMGHAVVLLGSGAEKETEQFRLLFTGEPAPLRSALGEPMRDASDGQPGCVPEGRIGANGSLIPSSLVTLSPLPPAASVAATTSATTSSSSSQPLPPPISRGIERYLLDLICSKRLCSEDRVPAALQASFLYHSLTQDLTPSLSQSLRLDPAPSANVLAARGQEALRFLKTHQFVCLSAKQVLRPSPFGMATTQAGLSPADAVEVLPWLLDARRGMVLSSALHLLIVLIPPTLLREGGMTFGSSSSGASGSMPTMPGDLPWHTFDSLLDRVVHHQPAAQALLDRFNIRRAVVSSFQFHSPSASFRASPQCAVYKRVYLACVLWVVSEAASSNALLALVQQHISPGQLQMLTRDCATFAGMIALFCQKLNYQALAACCEDLAQRLQSGGTKHLLPLLRIGVEINPHRAKALYEQGITNAREILVAGEQRLAQIFLRALPYHFRDALTLGPEQPSQGQAWGRPVEAREEKACERLAHSVVRRAEAYLREEMLRRSLLDRD